MTHVLVLGGGDSAEREVSQRSAQAMSAALKTAGYRVTIADPSQPRSDYNTMLHSADVIFPVLHGAGGEDGVLQAYLETRQLCYVGSDARSSELCFDKWRYKQKVQAAGITVPRGALVDEATLWDSNWAQQPFVLKPNDGGSSVDTFIIRSSIGLDRPKISAAFRRHQRMLVEELIEGQEITVGVVGQEAMPVVEIVPPGGGEFDYENKYNGQTLELCPPQTISIAIQQQAQAISLQIHNLVGCRDMSRTDFMISSVGELYVLETNTIPGMTDQSLLPKAVAVAGHSMPELVSILVEAALQRRRAGKP